MGNYCIRVQNLKKYFGDIKAVDGISFTVEAGSVFGMLGPNGAGKTTTIEILIGLQKRDGGEIDILGLDPKVDKKKLSEKIGVQLQSPALFSKLQVKELIGLFASFYNNPFPADKALSMLELEEKQDSPVGSLSGGQKHRLAVALAVVSNGDMIFLDEPTTGLDPQSRRSLWDVIKQLKNMGKTIFMTTHYMEEAEKLCDNLLIIDQGQVIARGAPGDLIAEYFEENAVEIIDSSFTDDETKNMVDFSGVTGHNFENGKSIILYTTDSVKTISDLLSFSKKVKKPITNINLRKPTLEDLFIKLTGRKIRH